MNKPVFEIDGSDSKALEEFAADFTAKLKLNVEWQEVEKLLEARGFLS